MTFNVYKVLLPSQTCFCVLTGRHLQCELKFWTRWFHLVRNSNLLLVFHQNFQFCCGNSRRIWKFEKLSSLRGAFVVGICGRMCAFLGSHSAAVPGLPSGSWELLSEFFFSILLLLQLGWTCSLLVCGLLWCGRRSPCKIPAFLTICGLLPSAGLRSCGCFWFVWVLLGVGLRWRLCSFILKFQAGSSGVSRLFSIPSLRWLCARMLCILGFFQTLHWILE